MGASSDPQPNPEAAQAAPPTDVYIWPSKAYHNQFDRNTRTLDVRYVETLYDVETKSVPLAITGVTENGTTHTIRRPQAHEIKPYEFWKVSRPWLPYTYFIAFVLFAFAGSALLVYMLPSLSLGKVIDKKYESAEPDVFHILYKTEAGSTHWVDIPTDQMAKNMFDNIEPRSCIAFDERTKSYYARECRPRSQMLSRYIMSSLVLGLMLYLITHMHKQSSHRVSESFDKLAAMNSADKKRHFYETLQDIYFYGIRYQSTDTRVENLYATWIPDNAQTGVGGHVHYSIGPDAASSFCLV